MFALPTRLSVDVLAVTRELPDTALAPSFAGEPMVQSFTLELGDGRTGRAWITTAEAFSVPGFGRKWVADRLAALVDERGGERVTRELAAGLRLHAGERLALPLAA